MLMFRLHVITTVLTTLALKGCLAWSPTAKVALSRGAFLSSLVSVPLVNLIVEPAVAASQIEDDRQKMLKGYQRLTYLLDNWEKETTVCKTGNDNPYLTGGGCERTPLKVMDYMGYRSTTDPLFKAEKTLRRLESIVPANKAPDFVEAADDLVQALDEASGLAFVSSWGEANPGGGKDRVQYFIERSKGDVTKARDALAIIVDILQ